MYGPILPIIYRISIHALLAESDDCNAHGNTSFIHFYPRSPCGERQYVVQCRKTLGISIHALLAESDKSNKAMSGLRHISIHALLAESDWSASKLGGMSDISIHALLAESDHGRVNLLGFQTIISIHALLAESDTHPIGVLVTVIKISIHALLAESDPIFSKIDTGRSIFLSTLSLRRATDTSSTQCRL